MKYIGQYFLNFLDHTNMPNLTYQGNKKSINLKTALTTKSYLRLKTTRNTHLNVNFRRTKNLILVHKKRNL